MSSRCPALVSGSALGKSASMLCQIDQMMVSSTVVVVAGRMDWMDIEHLDLLVRGSREGFDH